VVIDTCGFIDAAVEESQDAIGEALAENENVIVTGCVPPVEGVHLTCRGGPWRGAGGADLVARFGCRPNP
jgi:tRNA A37 methylthiotransferase MiaB